MIIIYFFTPFIIYAILEALWYKKFEKDCLDIMDKLNINIDYYKDIIGYMYDFHPPLIDIFFRTNIYENMFKDKKIVTNKIWYTYINFILGQLNLFYIDEPIYIARYIESHKEQLNKMKDLACDRHYKYNGVIVESLLSLVEPLDKPFEELENLNNLNISDLEKEYKKEVIEKNISKSLDMLLEIADKLDENATIEANKIDIITENSTMFYQLNNYKNNLSNIENKLKTNILNIEEVS